MAAPITAEEALVRVLRIVQEYLPPNSGISDKEALSRIIAAVDPWPIAMSVEMIDMFGRYLDEIPVSVITSCGVWTDGKQCAQRLKHCVQPTGRLAHGECPVHGVVPLFPGLDKA